MFTMSAQVQTGGTPLHLEAKIPLGAVSGRIDHLAIDLKRQRLFVAELGNDSIGVVDLAANCVQSTLLGLKEPAGDRLRPIDRYGVCRERRGRIGSDIARR